MSSTYNSRKFNLIPPKTKEEVEVLDERDNSFLYAFVLIFCAVIVFFFLTLAQTLIIEPRISSGKKAIEDINSEISSYDNLKKVHGELYIKSQALDSILLQDIKLTQLLDIAKDLRAGIPGSTIASYLRQANGQFAIDFRLRKYSDVDKLFDNSEKIPVIEGFNLKIAGESGEGQSKYIVATVGFKITNIINQEDGQ